MCPWTHHASAHAAGLSHARFWIPFAALTRCQKALRCHRRATGSAGTSPNVTRVFPVHAPRKRQSAGISSSAAQIVPKTRMYSCARSQNGVLWRKVTYFNVFKAYFNASLNYFTCNTSRCAIATFTATVTAEPSRTFLNVYLVAAFSILCKYTIQYK